ncbi:MAG TPA: ABC transporter substrate-binding protein [Chloroflexota bacterium]|nr:ABC transporter substrate-binding protein [Chloroflexota bacterium]
MIRLHPASSKVRRFAATPPAGLPARPPVRRAVPGTRAGLLHGAPRLRAIGALCAALLLSACGSAAPAASTPPSGPAASVQAGSASASAKPAASAGAGSSAASAKPAASAAAKPSAAAGGNLDHVKFAVTTGSTTAAGVYIANDRGYFKDTGIEVEMVPFSGGAEMISSIAANQVDIANTDPGAGLLNAIARNVAMRFVADGSHCDKDHCGTAFTVRKELVDSGKYKDLKDLKGLTINFATPGSTLYMFMNRLMDKAGLKMSDVKAENLNGFPALLPAFSNGALDAAWNIEPFTTQGVDKGWAVRAGTATDFFGPQQNTVLVYASQFAAQRQDAGKRFLVAELRGVRDWLDAIDKGKDYDQIIGIMTKESSLKDPALYKKIGLPGYDPNGQLYLDAVKTAQQWYVDHGDIKQPVDIDKLYDPQYLDYALAQLGKR